MKKHYTIILLFVLLVSCTIKKELTTEDLNLTKRVENHNISYLVNPDWKETWLQIMTQYNDTETDIDVFVFEPDEYPSGTNMEEALKGYISGENCKIQENKSNKLVECIITKDQNGNMFNYQRYSESVIVGNSIWTFQFFPGSNYENNGTLEAIRTNIINSIEQKDE